MLLSKGHTNMPQINLMKSDDVFNNNKSHNAEPKTCLRLELCERELAQKT